MCHVFFHFSVHVLHFDSCVSQLSHSVLTFSRLSFKYVGRNGDGELDIILLYIYIYIEREKECNHRSVHERQRKVVIFI